MLRSVGRVAGGQWPVASLLVVAAGLASAQIFPDRIGPYVKGKPGTVSVPDLPLYQEFGFETTEQAEYNSADKRFTATAWRFRDSTGAMAFFEERRPPGATPAQVTKLAVAASDGTIFAYGNYVFRFTGSVPDSADLEGVYAQLPKLEQSPLPVLMGMLPSDNLIPNSERYVLGPVSLDRFEPRISPSVAAFHLGTEAQTGKYQTAGGPMTLAIFNYPTPGIAQERYQEFQRIPGAVAKRTGPLVALIIQPPDPDAAERVLSQVRYTANLTWNEKIQGDPVKQTASMLLSIFLLAGIVILLCVVAGVGFGAFRVMFRKMGWRTEEQDGMIVLHLRDK